MNELIDALTQFTALRQHLPRADRVPLDQLIVQVRRELEPRSRGRHVLWQVSALPTVRGDVLLRQALTHLLDNALKYTAGREQTVIEVRHEVFPDEDVFSVRDNGVGFENRHADRLFQMFTRLAGHEDQPGRGIGLAHVPRIVTLYGGHVWTEGQPGEGATFYFSLPRAPASQPS